MMYSFIKPRPKPLFVPNTKIWFSFMGMAVVILFVFYGFLAVKIDSMEEKRAFFTDEREKIVTRITKIDEDMAFMQKQKAFYEEVSASNTLLKDSVKNLFELIPDQVTLTSVEMEKDTLILKGITPSKEVYSFLLAVPLKSIFTTSEAEFYMLTNSWYNFVSVNKLDKDGVGLE